MKMITNIHLLKEEEGVGRGMEERLQISLPFPNGFLNSQLQPRNYGCNFIDFVITNVMNKVFSNNFKIQS